MKSEFVARRRNGATRPNRGLVIAPGVAIVERRSGYRLLHIRSGCTLGFVDFDDAEQAAHAFFTELAAFDWTRHGAEIAKDPDVRSAFKRMQPDWIPKRKWPVHGYEDVTS